MKINEIVLLEDWVYEGLWDTLKAGYNTYQAGMAGAKAGYTSGGQQRAGAAKQQEVANVFIDRWNQAIRQNPAANTPQMLQQFMTNSTKQSGIAIPAAPTTLNPASTAKYITDVIGQSMAATTLGSPSTRDEPAQQPAPAEPKGPKLAPGVSITNDEPIMIKYKNADYTLNDQGQWAPATTPNKVVSQAMSNFLNQQHDAYLQSQPEMPAPAAPAAPAADPTPGEPAAAPAAPAAPAVTVSGAPVNSKTTIKAPGRRGQRPTVVNFFKTEGGWKSSAIGAKLHKPGTTHYDALEAQWAKENGQPAPAPTVVAPAAEPAPAAVESFRRLNKIIK